SAPENLRLNLSKNYDTGNPVRIVRSADLRSPFAANKGFRYDGLYIVRKLSKFISDDGRCNIVKYTLKRRENQSIAPWKKKVSKSNNPFLIKKLEEYKTKSEEKCRDIDSAYKSSRVDIHSCMKRESSPLKKHVTFKDKLPMNDTKKCSFKTHLPEITKKVYNPVYKSTSNSSMNGSFTKLNKMSSVKKFSPEKNPPTSVHSETTEISQIIEENSSENNCKSSKSLDSVREVQDSDENASPTSKIVSTIQDDTTMESGNKRLNSCNQKNVIHARLNSVQENTEDTVITNKSELNEKVKSQEINNVDCLEIPDENSKVQRPICSLNEETEGSSKHNLLQIKSNENVTSLIGVDKLQSKEENPLTELHGNDSSSGIDFGTSVNSLCLQLSQIESKHKSYPKYKLPSTQRKTPEKKQDLEENRNIPVKDPNTKKRRTVPDVDSSDRKKRKYKEKQVNSQITSSGAQCSKNLVHVMNPINCNSAGEEMKSCMTNVQELEEISNDNISCDTQVYKESKTNNECILDCGKNCSSVLNEQNLMLKSEKLLPTVTLTRLSNEHIKKISSAKKNVNLKQMSRKRKLISDYVKESKKLSECHVVLKRLEMPYVREMETDESDSWFGWQVHMVSLKSCDSDLTTISESSAQTQIINNENAIVETQVETNSVPVEPTHDEHWKGWKIIDVYIDNEKNGWFCGW
ncbi:hypothetical protein L9F63_017579, partial [Diploptera punctata]